MLVILVDGHNMTHQDHFKSTHDSASVHEAYAKGVAICGCDILKQCTKFEDTHLSADLCKKLLNAGINFTDMFIEHARGADLSIEGLQCEEFGAYLHPESFIDIYLYIASLGEPTLKYERGDTSNELYRGGYGLFKL
eukprot:m.198650 g.198650  ORF g.198650 m.198650 type:complete len:137 (-) comp32702_c1_seq2:323-733(-)